MKLTIKETIKTCLRHLSLHLLQKKILSTRSNWRSWWVCFISRGCFCILVLGCNHAPWHFLSRDCLQTNLWYQWNVTTLCTATLGNSDFCWGHKKQRANVYFFSDGLVLSTVHTRPWSILAKLSHVATLSCHKCTPSWMIGAYWLNVFIYLHLIHDIWLRFF